MGQRMITNTLFGKVEGHLKSKYSIKLEIMDEERRTAVNLKCIREVEIE